MLSKGKRTFKTEYALMLLGMNFCGEGGLGEVDLPLGCELRSNWKRRSEGES